MSKIEEAYNEQRQAALDRLKSLVLSIKGRKINNFEKEKRELDEVLSALNSCDTLWVNDEYAKWHRNEIETKNENRS